MKTKTRLTTYYKYSMQIFQAGHCMYVIFHKETRFLANEFFDKYIINMYGMQNMRRITIHYSYGNKAGILRNFQPGTIFWYKFIVSMVTIKNVCTSGYYERTSGALLKTKVRLYRPADRGFSI